MSHDGPFLILDTAGPRGVVAVGHHREVLAERYLDEPRRHAELLAAAIEEVLGEASIRRAALRGVVCGTGPGSFVGVRVAMSAAKGIAFGLSIPVHGVTTLAGLAADPEAEGLNGLAVLDARRGELYVSEFQTDADGHLQLAAPNTAAPERVLEDGLELVIGHLGTTGAHLLAQLDQRPGCEWLPRPGPTAAGLLRALGEPPFADQAATLVPDYARAPDAKLPSPRLPSGP